MQSTVTLPILCPKARLLKLPLPSEMKRIDLGRMVPIKKKEFVGDQILGSIFLNLNFIAVRFTINIYFYRL